MTIPEHEPTWWAPLSAFYLAVTLRVWDSIVQDMTAPAKAGLLSRVSGTMDDPASVRVREIAKRVSDLAPKRNLATHGHWNVDQPSGQVCARSRRRPAVLNVEELGPLEAELTALSEAANEAKWATFKELPQTDNPLRA